MGVSLKLPLPRRRFAAVAVLSVASVGTAVLWVLVGAALNQRQPDLGVYYFVGDLGDLLYDGNVVKAFMPDGGLPFTYTPFAAVLFRMMALVPFELFIVVWASMNVAAAALVVRLLAAEHSRRWEAAALVVTLFSTIMAAHIMMGQLNAILLLLVVADIVPDRRAPWRRYVPVGVGVGIAAAVKLTPVIFIVFLLLTCRRRAAATAILTVLGCFMIGALVYPQSTAAFFGQLPVLADRVDVLGYFATVNNTSVSGALAQFGVVPPTLMIGAIVCMLGLVAAIYVRPLGEAAAVALLCLVPCLATPITWLHHWVALPIALCVAMRFARTSLCRFGLGALVATQLLGSVYVAYVDWPPELDPLVHAFALSPIFCSVGVMLTLLTAARRSRQLACIAVWDPRM